MTSPASKIKDLIKESLGADQGVRDYLRAGEKSGAGILTDFYSDLGEQDLPCCVITTIDEDLSRLSQDEMERSEIQIIVEFHGYQRKSVNLDDFSFHVRKLLSTMPVREKLGTAFQGLRIEKIAYDRQADGTKPVQQVAFKVKTFYDIELFDSWTGGMEFDVQIHPQT